MNNATKFIHIIVYILTLMPGYTGFNTEMCENLYITHSMHLFQLLC